MNKKFNHYTEKKLFWDNVIINFKNNLYPPDKGEPKGFFHLAASGGSTAQIFDQLKQQSFDLSNVELWQVDERYVPKDHPDSNYQLLNQKIGNQVKKFHSFDTSLSITTAVKKYETECTKKILDLDSNYLFDLTILGVGTDGHIASIFPQTELPTIQENQTPIEVLAAHTHTDNFSISDRLTLTYSALKQSRAIMVILLGANKKNIWEQIQNAHPEKTLPVHNIRDWESVRFWWLDHETQEKKSVIPQ